MDIARPQVLEGKSMSKSPVWIDKFAAEINKFKLKFGDKAFKKNKLEFRLKVAKRVESFSGDCDECKRFRVEIKNLIGKIGDPITAKEEGKKHSRVFRTITEHLQKDHKLVTEKENLQKWLPIGLIMGIVLGSSIGVPGVGVGVGIVIGLTVGAAIGTSLDVKAKKRDRVI